MSYTISVIVAQAKDVPSFQIVEKTIWNLANGGTWTHSNDKEILTMGGSGTSGSLRFVADTGENFIVTFGVHSYKRWGDIVTDLRNDETATTITPQYYSNDHSDREAAREAQRTQYSVRNSRGRNFSFHYTVAEGNHLKVNVVIA